MLSRLCQARSGEATPWHHDLKKTTDSSQGRRGSFKYHVRRSRRICVRDRGGKTIAEWATGKEDS